MTLKLDDYGRKKEINAFKVLAGDDDHLMSLSKVQKILIDNGMSYDEVEFFTEQIKKDTRFYDMDSDSVVYSRFLKSM